MKLLESKLKAVLFLEDQRTANEKLADEFVKLDKDDKLLKLAGCFQVHSIKKWMLYRVKYRRHRVFNLGYWQVSWANIAVGKK